VSKEEKKIHKKRRGQKRRRFDIHTTGHRDGNGWEGASSGEEFHSV
jgi:hypothetical protein